MFNDVLDIWYVVVYFCNWVRIDLFFMFFVLCLDFVLLFKISIFVVFIGILSVLLLCVIIVLFILYKLFLVIFIILFFVLYWFRLLVYVFKLYLMGCVDVEIKLWYVNFFCIGVFWFFVFLGKFFFCVNCNLLEFFCRFLICCFIECLMDLYFD